MQTHFSPQQLADPATADANAQLRACVHCGFCTATCPTYLVLGDELDSPRGRIYLIKEMLEKKLAPPPTTVLHLDRCLGCFSCMTHCPSGVNYMHLFDHARAYIEQKKARSWPDRMLRAALVKVLTDRGLFRFSLLLAGAGPAVHGAVAATAESHGAPGAHHPAATRSASPPGTFAAEGKKHARMALLSGCVQPVLAPGIDEAAVRLLTRHGIEVAIAQGQVCCGAMAHHLGDERDRHDANQGQYRSLGKRNRGELDAIIVSASGCGTVVKDYGFMLKDDPAIGRRGRRAFRRWPRTSPKCWPW